MPRGPASTRTRSSGSPNGRPTWRSPRCTASPARCWRFCLAGAVERREPHGVWGGEIFTNGAIIAEKRPRGRPPRRLSALWQPTWWKVFGQHSCDRQRDIRGGRVER